VSQGKKWPDFLGKDETESYKSESVLGKLYREIPTDKQYEECLEAEYRYSIEYRYMLNQALKNRFLKNAKQICPFLPGIFEEIVKPMTAEIIELMSQNNLINEAELFCSDLKFRAHKRD